MEDLFNKPFFKKIPFGDNCLGQCELTPSREWGRGRKPAHPLSPPSTGSTNQVHLLWSDSKPKAAPALSPGPGTGGLALHHFISIQLTLRGLITY